MKKIFLTTAIFIAMNNFCFSQEEENKNFKPQSRVGGTVDFGGTDDKKVGINMFYHHTLTRFCFLSINAGYNRYDIDQNFYTWKKTIRNEIPITVGINICIPYYNFRLYTGIELGVNTLYIRDEFIPNIYSSETHDNYSKKTGLFGFGFGISYPILDIISLEANTRINLEGKKYMPFSCSLGFLNLGISYLLPW